jgi:hypothetical protein
MQRSASLQLALHYMQLRNEKLSEIPALVCPQHGQELAGRHPILYPCQGQVRMKRTILRGETETGEDSHQTLIKAS